MTQNQRIATHTPAHDALVEKAAEAKKCLVSLLDEGSRDFELMEHFLTAYISYQHGADVVSGQTKVTTWVQS